jgi:hypothetical protein
VKLVSFSDDQLATVLRCARLIEDDTQRDRYFESVADALRGRVLDDRLVRYVAAAAFKKYRSPRDE